MVEIYIVPGIIVGFIGLALGCGVVIFIAYIIIKIGEYIYNKTKKFLT